MIREIFDDKTKTEICRNILRELSDWFGIEESTQAYIDGVAGLPFFSYQEEGKDIGFISLYQHFPSCAEVYVMGIFPEYHRKGIGHHLLSAAENYLRGKGVSFLQVKTLSESRPDEFYDKTRQFYLKCGFLPVEEFPTLWNESNPCLLLIKGL